MNRFLEKTLTAAALVLGPTVALAQTPAAVGVVTTLSGEATVARAALAQPAAMKFRDPVYTRDRITTAEKSIVRVLLGGKALVTARELSVLTISESPLRSTVTLDAGKVAASVIKARMQPGEIIEFRTPNAVAVVRGTVLVVEVSEGPVPANGGPAPVTTTVSVVNGLVDVFSLASASMPPARVGGHESVRVTDDRLGTVRGLSQQEVRLLTTDLEVAPNQQQPQAKELPAGMRRSIGATEQAKAAAVASLLAPAVKPVGTTTNAIDQTVSGTLDATVKVGDQLLDTVDSVLLEATAPILGGTSKLLGSVGGTLQTTTDTVGTAVGGVTSTAGAVVGGAAGAVGGTVGGVTGTLTGTTSGVTSTLGGVTGTLTGTTTGVTSTLGGVTGTLTGTTSGVTSTLGGVTGTLTGTTTGVTSTLGGVTGGVTGTVGGVTSGVTGVVGGVTGGLGRLLKP